MIETARELELRVPDLPRVSAPDRVLMADPGHYDVVYAINPHMRLGRRVDRARAVRQWNALRLAFEALGFPVDVVPALPGQPDLVFCANPVLHVPCDVTGRAPEVLPSRMAHAERSAEVAHVVRTLVELGHRAAEPTLSGPIEGEGDGLWHPGRRLLWAGVGPRSNIAAWREVSSRYLLPVVPLKLVDADFYNLDTCFQLLDETTCLWTPAALDPASRELVRSLVPRRIEADPSEARQALANNVCCPDGSHVLIDSSCERTSRALAREGFEVIPVDTSEFLRAGGSVFCMKLLLGPLSSEPAEGA